MIPLIRIILSIMIAVIVSGFLRAVFEVSLIISIIAGAFFGGMSVAFLRRIGITQNSYIKKILMSKVLAIFGGLIAMAGSVVLVIFVWRREFYEFVFGSIPIFLFFGGLIALIAGINSIVDDLRAKKLKEEAKEKINVGSAQ